ncbi:4Fe-4S dicluster domain-containing protein [Candidatus Bipolaricaulota bacterium]|nr:4Fe-4S dicluster domain-containing protein [Candidatus Bipolaricaulota bacterium]
MSARMLLAVGLLVLVGFTAGAVIFLVSKVLPKEDESLEETARIKEFLPGGDCGACGHPGCFAYAQAVAIDKNIFAKKPCPPLAATDVEGMVDLAEYLGMQADDAGRKKAVIHCTGDSEILADYRGIKTCEAALQIASGFKGCPYACLGFGDCISVCPVDAIFIDKAKNIAVVDWEKCIGCGLCIAACPQGLTELVPVEMPQYLGCNYRAPKEIPGRKRCSSGCIHCRICVRVSPGGEVSWNEALDLPCFDPEKSVRAPAAIEKCPRKIIVKTAVYEEISADVTLPAA